MRWLAPLILCASFSVTNAVGQENFEAEVNALHEKVSETFEKASEFAKKGDTDAAKRELLGFLDRDKSPAATLVIADSLYKTDRETSYKLHKQAYDARPKERSTILEWAMEQHRAGKYAEAVPLYQEYLKLQPEDERMNALLADCLIRTGKLKEAVAAWDAANHGSNHTGIDFAIYEIYGELSPAARRGELVKQIRAGKLELIEKLVDLDLHFNQDWWNSGVEEASLNLDLAMIQDLLKGEQSRWEEIQCWVDIAKDDTISPADVKARLKKAGLIIDGGKLPANTLVAERLMAELLDRELATRAELLKPFEAELLKRAKSEAGDVEALNVLCNLSQENEEQLGKYDEYGWERYGDIRFAGGTLAALNIKQKLNGDSPELKKALEQFPENGIINQFSLRMTSPEQVTKEQFVRAIKAEYHELSQGLAIRDSYTLKSHFALLKAKLQSEN